MSAPDTLSGQAWRGRVQSVERAVALLDAIAGASPRGSTVAELALACGINRATAWRLLATLEGRGLVDRDPATSRYVPITSWNGSARRPAKPRSLPWDGDPALSTSTRWRPRPC